ncbi:UDP-N-acetylmuramate dehydrogenase [Fontisphaera persica]|uniref:UDP-N-acetylmuramate dehydrogenase n=1 Tax=Fontisphaera persica TaxID=2974023 RepID=UPI0024BF6136|nr:UDP-N-acetylmuramate dehydrogenase [Fontisphaera persica]WCJ61198.1 UDP-N-acetylmuramate dehydrogenase [Fontisphaera persica]
MALNIRENEPLSRHTTLRVGGPARYWVEVAGEAELREAAAWAADASLPLFVLGGGSNVLASDHGFPGVVVHMASRGATFADVGGAYVRVIAEAGEEWDALVAEAVERNLAGWETMALIPGTLGGAVAGNIGAYGAEIKDTLEWVEAMNRRDGKLARFSLADCQMQYRHSFFKTPAGREWAVVRASFLLQRGAPPRLDYPELRARLTSPKPTLAEVRQTVIHIRQAKLPDWQKVGTAGSFFKNLRLDPEDFQQLRRRYPELPGYAEADGRIKVPLGYILDKICGLRGWGWGKVRFHERQALVLINEGGTAADIAQLAHEAARRVREATGLAIEWEVEPLGDWERPPA